MCTIGVQLHPSHSNDSAVKESRQEVNHSYELSNTMKLTSDATLVSKHLPHPEVRLYSCSLAAISCQSITRKLRIIVKHVGTADTI